MNLRPRAALSGMARATKPWSRSNPRKKAGNASKKLSPSQKASAKASAKRAGRPYPNLVDNMRAASKTTTGKAAKKKSAKKHTTRKAAKKKVSKKKAAKSR